MTPEKDFQDGPTTKQKIMAAILIVVLLVIIWQIIGLFRGDKTPPPTTVTPTSKPTPGTPGAMNAGVTPAGSPPPSGAAPTPAVQASNEPPPVREAPVMMDSQTSDLQKKTDQKYIDQLNQLQILKVQREIAETNQAIASARLATVTAEKSVSDLLTRPSQPQTPGALSSAPPSTEVPATTETGVVIPPPPPPTATVVPPPSLIKYTVASVSMQLGRWSAVITYQDKLFNVSMGDILPLDNSIVTSINKNGVTLVTKGKRRRIALISTI